MPFYLRDAYGVRALNVVPSPGKHVWHYLISDNLLVNTLRVSNKLFGSAFIGTMITGPIFEHYLHKPAYVNGSHRYT